ncbi:hypothetical proteinATU3145 [Candidatus Vecturithrix granuli]|uniref:Cupin type-2 domain-containing protein n=1 Tax=Vecturithrix granuli TaxID=1499967 RepID=A0A0S6WB32_VECG1|nr:hypothetical proteinATU3145 [Candidatus Vecturithrix granuli]
MLCYHEKIRKQDIGGGILVQVLGHGQNMNVLHWNFAEKSQEVKMHQHVEEQFGYVIKGGFNITIQDEVFTIMAGDAYFIPSNIPHSFAAIGETEAIDVFSPVRKDIPWKE